MAGKQTQQLDTPELIQKRRYCLGTITLGMPSWYLFKHRNTIYKSTKLMREFHFKEVAARSILGFFVGIGVSVALYGLGPYTVRDTSSMSASEQRESGKTEEDRKTLEYSVMQKKKYIKKHDFLPGKIRDDE